MNSQNEGGNEMRKKRGFEEVAMIVFANSKIATKGLESKILKKALESFSSHSDVETIAGDIFKVVEARERTMKLNGLLEKVVSRLDEEERLIVDYKYFNNRAIDGFDCTSRNYFRKQNKMLKHLKELLGYIGLDEKSFYRDYGDLPCVRLALLKLNLKKKSSKSQEARASLCLG